MQRSDNIAKINRLFVIFVMLLVFIYPHITIEAKIKYATTTINIRAAPNIKSKVVGNVYWNEKVNVINKVNNSWFQVKYKGKMRYLQSKYLRNNRYGYKIYRPPSLGDFKSYEDADCITDSSQLVQGKLKSKYHLDSKSGIWMIGNRYCIAIGSYYFKNIGDKVDIILYNNGKRHTIKCIIADCKAKRDTVNNHRIHTDGSIVEFIVRTRSLTQKTILHGNVSYEGEKFKGYIEKIKVYKE